MWLQVACALACVTSLRAEVATIASIVSNRADENIDFNTSFVNEIKANLQNNNDDYATDDPINIDSTATLRVDNRRRYNSSEAEDETTEPSPTSLLTTLVTKAEALARAHVKQHNNNNNKMKTTTFVSATKEEDEPAKAKGNVYKWKRLVEKNKRLRKYTSTPKIELTSATHSPRVSYSVPIGRAPVNKLKRKRRPRPRQVNRNVLPLRSPGPMRKPPNADQLDMAPARGAYIHDLRLKGRFCHRHVLWPEGPKYNSKGETIMPAFNSSLYKKKRSFFQTTKPSFMLPRCCNCCKKSVLGCQ